LAGEIVMNTELWGDGTGKDAARLLQRLRDGMTLAGELHHAVPAFLIAHGCPATASHCAAVANEARRIAILFGADADGAERAGWFHDVSAIFPTATGSPPRRHSAWTCSPKRRHSR